MNICFHEYEKWSRAYETTLGVRQSTYCKKCNKIKIRNVKINSSSRVVDVGTANNVNSCFRDNE